MIPVVQFDPSSLSLWYDAHLIGSCRGRRELGLALEHAILGDDRELQLLVDCIDDTWVQTRAANIASAVWHEKRHFLDFVTTNYGALRIRHFFEAYGNAGTLLAKAKDSNRLLLPLDSNLDTLTREMMGIGEVDPTILEIARGIASRKAILTQDRAPIESHLGLIDLGGEAIMEAIAYHMQHGKLHRTFGMDINSRVQQDNPGATVVKPKYTWAYETLVRGGILNVTVVEGEGNVMRVDDAPLIPLLYGALASRAWKQEQTRGEGVSSYLPAERLGSLIPAILDRYPNYKKMSCQEAWEAVNSTCKRIFGRTVIEETEADFDLEAQFIDRLEQTHGDTHFVKAYADLHKMRKKALGLLIGEPALFIDQGVWSDRMVNRTKPAIVIVASGGEVGPVPDGFQSVSSYRHPNTNFDEKPDARWWWAIMKKDWPTAGEDTETLCVSDLESWAYLAGEYAPLAKLIYAGHDIRVMAGPEVMGARLRFQETTGIKIVIDPAFSYPKATHDVSWWYYITGYDNFRCQLSSETVQKPEGFMLDAWDLRLRPGLREAMLGAAADRERMAFTFWRDWSPWLVSEEFREYFESFEADEAAFYDTL